MKDGPMRNKLHRVIFSTLLAASVGLAMAPAAQASRGNGGGGGGGGGGYVPAVNPAGPPVVIQVDLPDTPVDPQLSDTGAITDPGASPEAIGDDPTVDPAIGSDVLGNQTTRAEPEVAEIADLAEESGVFGGVLSRTGSEAMPLARAGLAAITLGLGFIMLGHRRRQAAASA